MILLKKLLSRMVLLLVIVLSACNLNREPIVWINDVKPQFVCPGDSVNVSWNGGDEHGCLGGGCSELIVSIASDPSDVLTISNARNQGETVAGPIIRDTTFTFSATGGRDSRIPETHGVDVVLPDRETNTVLGFASTCSGSATVFQDADLSIPEFRAEGVRLVHVCNTTTHVISLTLFFEFGSQRWTLTPGRCTEDLPPDVGSKVLSAHASSVDLIGPPARCDTSFSIAPDLELLAALACDVMSASMPIVIATPGSATPESGIIVLPTELFTVTPETALFILTVQVPANCRQGPGVEYPVVNSALQGEQVQVIGKSVDGTWWYSQIDNDICFISNIAGTPSGDLNLLPFIQAAPPPLPTTTVAATEEEQPTAIPEIDFDKDGYGVSVDCNDKDPNINPGAVEKLNDKVDSNCNGDINK